MLPVYANTLVNSTNAQYKLTLKEIGTLLKENKDQTYLLFVSLSGWQRGGLLEYTSHDEIEL